jgi:hypothetical protein
METSMNRTWITGLTLATVAGSGGAFVGVAAGSHDTPAAAQPQSLVKESALLQPVQTAQTTPATPSRTVNYLVGAAGAVTLTVANGSLTINQTAVGAGWAVAGSTAPGTHVEVQYTDTLQLVTFAADLVGNDVVVSVTNLPVPGTLTTAAAEPITITEIKTANPAPRSAASQPQPAAPPPVAAPAAEQPPAPAATTAPSGSGDDGNHNDDGQRESNDD